jgi:predicted transcriptional regulator
MRKTSVYLDEEHVRRLRQVAALQGRSQAEVLRDAILSYTERVRRPRHFALARVAAGPGDSVADLDEAALLRGFGA